MRSEFWSILAIASLVLPAVVGGCAYRSGFDVDRVENVASNDGLSVAIKLPRRHLRIGEDLRVTVTATNGTGKAITLDSPTGAPVLIRVIRKTMLAGEDIRFYPRSATPNIHSWTLPAGESRTFEPIVPVEPDWPVAEILYISAELNGYPKVAPAVHVTVEMPKGPAGGK